MRPLFRMLLSHCWSNAYLLVGVCMGLGLSLFLAPVNTFSEYPVSEPLPPDALADDYEPRIDVDAKPQRARKVSKTFVRPRYYSTELGIREKLFVGILTSREHLHSRGVALNKTLAHLVSGVRYFISVAEGTKPNVSLPGIVGFTDTRSLLMPFHVVKYIVDNYLEDYDYYFLVKDTGYVHGRRLTRLLEKIAVSRDVHVGTPTMTSTYCSLESGILLSNSVVRELRSNLDWCVRHVYSESDDVNFGRCIVRSTSLPCSDKIQGQVFRSLRLPPDFQFEEDFARFTNRGELADTVVVYPVYDRRVIYQLHLYITAATAVELRAAVSLLREASLKTTSSCPAEERDISWPVGDKTGNRAPTRFDVLRWTFFNNSHAFLESELSGVRRIDSDTGRDVDRAVRIAVDEVIESSGRPLRLRKLSNGYRRFDASRGMDYLLDLDLLDVETGKVIERRVQLCKPLGKVEILPVPYVTENTRINLILVVGDREIDEALDFVDRYAIVCMQGKQRTFLMVVLLYEYDAPSRGGGDPYSEVKRRALDLTEKYRKDRSKIGWLSIRLPPTVKIASSDPTIRLAAADLCTRKLPTDSLMLFVECGTDLRLDYLNRVRMNTIGRYQIFSPIPFVEYNPDVARVDDSSSIDLDVNRNGGRYDQADYDNIAFYARDYLAMRRTVEANVPLVRSDKDIPRLLKISGRSALASLFDLFVSFSSLHPLRAVEPALKVRYREIDCRSARNDTRRFPACLSRKYHGLGQRSQLAKLVLDYRHSPK